MKKIFYRFIDLFVNRLIQRIKPIIPTRDEKTLLAIGKILSNQNLIRQDKLLLNIQLAEFSIFSQFGDDGIIQFLINYLEIKEKKFIEFGVEDYFESNTRFLLINDNWKGLVMDGAESNVNRIMSWEFYWKYELTAKALFVDKDNINPFLIENGFVGEIGLLHIDLDGNDYWIWKQIDIIQPIIVIVEYNAIFGYENAWSIPYNKTFYRTNAHYSNLFWGTSLLSLCDLGEEKGYVFIGTNSSGNNAYFIKKGYEKDLKILTAKEGFTISKHRESRDSSGNLTYLTGRDRIDAIKGCQIFNTRNLSLENI